MSGYLKRDKVPCNGGFHTLDLEKAFSFRGLRPLTPLPCLFLGKKALKHSKEYFVSGCLKPDKVPGNGGFHTLDLGGKAFSLHCPWMPPRAAEEPRSPTSRLFDFSPFPILHCRMILTVTLLIVNITPKNLMSHVKATRIHSLTFCFRYC